MASTDGPLVLLHEVDAHPILRGPYILAYFRNATGFKSAVAFQATISASAVRELHDLEPLAADTEDTKGSTQLRISHRMWKVKLKPGERVTIGATRHINAAIAQNNKLFNAALTTRGCREIPAGLLSALCTPGTTALTVGQLRTELLAIRLHDQLTARLEMEPDRALTLVYEAVAHARHAGGIDLEADLTSIGRLMVLNEMSFQQALLALKTERTLAEPEQAGEADSAPVTFHRPVPVARPATRTPDAWLTLSGGLGLRPVGPESD